MRAGILALGLCAGTAGLACAQITSSTNGHGTTPSVQAGDANAAAQQKTSETAQLQRRPSPAPEYVLGIGDQISLHAADVDDLPATPVRIDPSGYIDIPLAGRVEAAGLTLTELKASLVAKLSEYITNPEVSINLASSGSQPVSVVGEVANPGVHQLDGNKRLIEVLSLSGGLKPDAGPVVLVTREAKWGAIDATDLKKDPIAGTYTASFPVDELMTLKTPADNILIRPDDVISVPRAELVYVLGDVKKAGGFQLSTHGQMTLLQVLSLAEGVGPDSASRHARILRQEPGGDGTPREIPIDIDRITTGKSPDVKLYANDVLFVPHSGAKVTSRRALEAAIGVTTGILIYR